MSVELAGREQIGIKVPSQEESEVMLEAFKDKLKND